MARGDNRHFSHMTLIDKDEAGFPMPVQIAAKINPPVPLQDECGARKSLRGAEQDARDEPQEKSEFLHSSTVSQNTRCHKAECAELTHHISLTPRLQPVPRGAADIWSRFQRLSCALSKPLKTAGLLSGVGRTTGLKPRC